jgi:hypothetical protein
MQSVPGETCRKGRETEEVVIYVHPYVHSICGRSMKIDERKPSGQGLTIANSNLERIVCIFYNMTSFKVIQLEMVRGTGFEAVCSALPLQAITNPPTLGDTRSVFDPDWAKVVAAWPTLAPALKAAVIAIIQSK